MSDETETSFVVTGMSVDDWPQVQRIYEAGIATGHATFETSAPDWAEFDRTRVADHRLVAVALGDVVGWAACVRVSARAVYAGVLEHSVYVAPQVRGQGVGSLLLEELIASTEQAGTWTLQSSIFPENEASLRLHLAHGFRVVGTRERIARTQVGPLAGQWRDTLLVERRAA